MVIRQAELKNILIGALLLILGGVVGYKYGQTGQLPLNSQVWLNQSGAVTSKEQPEKYQSVSFSTFWEVWESLEREYLKTDKLVPTDMVNGAISGMTSALGDPYTVYLPPVDNQRSGEDLAGSFYGVGIELGYINNTLAVVSPLAGMPAERAGVKAGDLILHVKDESKSFDEDTAGWSLNEAVSHIRGEKGTSVTLTLLREGATEPITTTLTRDEIVVPTVELSFEGEGNDRVAHLKLMKFGERTPSEWDTAVAQILQQKNGIKGIVLDMRNNPGGFFDGAIAISSDFIENGVVVSQKGKFSKQDFRAQGVARLDGIPLVVVVNRGSASAAEIVAGALKDELNATLVGEKTFGKGTVQDRKELTNGGGLHVTVAEWLTPDGSSIHEAGIPVSIEVSDNAETEEDEVLQRAMQELRG
jgi:carboxyl-terminal processing protease